MKILLIGEYSRLHNSLKEGLLALGHEVVLVGEGDYFKNYPVDEFLGIYWSEKYVLLKKIRILFHKLTGKDIGKWETALRFFWLKNKLKSFDIVQFINSNALGLPLIVQENAVKFIKNNNDKLFLLTCGSETPVIEKNLHGLPELSIVTPFLKGELNRKQMTFHFQYITKAYQKYYLFFENQIDKIIVSDMDYLLPMLGHPKLVGLIPNPVNIDKISFQPLSDPYPIVIFHGVNRVSRNKKGSHYFEQALEKVRQKFTDRVEIITSVNLPYDQYMKVYLKAHIVLDMVYACDQGYNALEAMARGKVVFTGAGSEFMQHYGLEKRVAVHALPNVDYLFDELTKLIENPSEIVVMGQRARRFVEKEHHYIQIAQRYVETWSRPQNNYQPSEER